MNNTHGPIDINSIMRVTRGPTNNNSEFSPAQKLQE